MPLVSLQDVKINYEKTGQGPALVLIGGLANDLSFSHFTVITLDNRGVGKTVYPNKGFTVEEMAADVIHLLDYLQIDQAHVVGFSLGGAIAQVVASRSPKVSKLVLIGTTLKFSLVSKMTARFQLYLRKNTHDKNILSLGLLPWLFSSEFLSKPQVVEKIAEKLYGKMDETLFAGYEKQVAALESFIGDPYISDISNPCLIIHGEEDLLILPRHVQLMHKLLAHSKLSLIAETGHMVIYEQPKEVCSQILRFFK